MYLEFRFRAYMRYLKVMGRTKGSEAGNLSVSKRGTKGKDRSGVISKTGFDGPTSAPWRKTVSIFKQPVTLVHTTSRETKSPPNERRRTVRGSSDPPRQLFWPKALENLRAMMPICNPDRITLDENEHVAHSLDLAGKMEPALSVINSEAAAASLCASVHLHTTGSPPITGQNVSKKVLESNPFLNVNPAQPFIQALSITEQDIQAQEKRVLDMRKRLQEARRHLHC